MSCLLPARRLAAFPGTLRPPPHIYQGAQEAREGNHWNKVSIHGNTLYKFLLNMDRIRLRWAYARYFQTFHYPLWLEGFSAQSIAFASSPRKPQHSRRGPSSHRPYPPRRLPPLAVDLNAVGVNLLKEVRDDVLRLQTLSTSFLTHIGNKRVGNERTEFKDSPDRLVANAVKITLCDSVPSYYSTCRRYRRWLAWASGCYTSLWYQVRYPAMAMRISYCTGF